MSSLIDSDVEYRFNRGLRGYLEAVTAALGIGLESCTVDLDTPVAAYIAIDWRFTRFPGRDVALIWDERHGWAATIEAGCGEDVIVLAYLGGDDVLPDPRHVVRFLAALRADDHSLGQPGPPGIRRAGNHGELLERLA